MGRYVYVVMTNPVEGREAEYNAWYDDVHLKDVCSAPGFVGARRFRLADGESPHRYLALYEMETDDPQRDLASLTALAGTDGMRMSDALDLTGASAVLFEQIAEYEK
jgi:hypothetical protein